jgi:glutamate-ammonia-ligase adenylyltransferase
MIVLPETIQLCPHLTALLAEAEDLPELIETQGHERVLDSLLDKMEQDALRAADTTTMMAVLRRCKRRAAFLIALADLTGVWTLEETTLALSRLAESAVLQAVRFLLKGMAKEGLLVLPDPEVPETGSGLVILAMGKLGGHELNYSSDIDLIILYDQQLARSPDPEGLPPAFIRLARELVRILELRTADGYVFRTDLRLRPDPNSTPAAVSTNAAEVYYCSQALNWERAAMIKARPIASDPLAARSFIRVIQPFLWRRHLDFAAIRDVQAIMAQIHAVKGGKTPAVGGHNIKLGKGGIREIEFYAQTQQLIYGGRDSRLRLSGTVETLRALAKVGKITAVAAVELSDSYRFLRKLEHRLQMVDDRQTHTVPEDEDERATIARLMDMPTLAGFDEALGFHLARVSAYGDQIFAGRDNLTALAGGLDDGNLPSTLQQLGFRSVDQVAPLVEGWQQARHRCLRTPRAQELIAEILPTLLRALAGTADPDSAALNFDGFLARLPAGVQLLSLFAANINLVTLLAEIMGTAPSLADQLSRTPQLLEAVLEDGFFGPLPHRPQLEAELAHAQLTARDYEDRLELLRRWSGEQRFRGGVHILLNLTPADRAAAFFTLLAELTLGELLKIVEAEFALKHGGFGAPALCLLALGKLGAGQMSVGSDVDLIAIYDVPPARIQSDGARPLSPPDYFTRLLARLVEALTALSPLGRLYEIDLRLRPSGNKGPLAAGLESFRRYHHEAAWTWEHMALTRARPIAGPPALCQTVRAVIREVLTIPRSLETLRADVIEMRGLMAGQHPAQGPWDLKYRRGGLIDIEFIHQFLLLKAAADSPALLDDPSPLDGFPALAKAGQLDPIWAEQLAASYGRFLRLQTWLRLTHDFFRGQSPTPTQLAGMSAALHPHGPELTGFSSITNRIGADSVANFGIYRTVLDDSAGFDRFEGAESLDSSAFRVISASVTIAGGKLMQLKVGMPAPDFTLPLGTFGTVALSNMRGKPVVLYFYPKDDTPGCTTEACSFRDTLPAFGNHDAAVIGVSKDSVESHAAFAKKYGLNFHLASDAHSNVCETYGVMVQKSNYGKTYTGIERATFLIDTHGIIRAIWRKVSVPGHVEEVLQSVEALRLGLPLPGQEPPPPPPAPVPPKPVAAKPAAKTVPAPKGVAKPVAKVEAQKPAAKKKPVAKAPVKKVVAKKPTVKKVVAKKAVAKKPAAPKKPAQKVVTKKVAAKKPAVKKLVAKKKPAKKKR